MLRLCLTRSHTYSESDTSHNVYWNKYTYMYGLDHTCVTQIPLIGTQATRYILEMKSLQWLETEFSSCWPPFSPQIPSISHDGHWLHLYGDWLHFTNSNANMWAFISPLMSSFYPHFRMHIGCQYTCSHLPLQAMTGLPGTFHQPLLRLHQGAFIPCSSFWNPSTTTANPKSQSLTFPILKSSEPPPKREGECDQKMCQIHSISPQVQKSREQNHYTQTKGSKLHTKRTKCFSHNKQIK